MVKTRDYLREAKMFSIVGGIVSWIWLIGTVVGVIWLGGAIFSDFSWWVAIALLAGAQFFKAAAREFMKSEKQAITEGIEAGQLYVDEKNRVRPVTDRATS